MAKVEIKMGEIGGGSILNPTLIWKPAYNDYGVAYINNAIVGKTYLLVDNTQSATDISNLSGATEIFHEALSGFVMGSSSLVTGFVKIIKATATTITWTQGTTFNMMVVQLD